MPEIKQYSPGAFCWAEVGTVNVAQTKAFYSGLFGWSYDERPAGEFGTYTMVRKEGKDLAGLYELPPSLIQMGVPPHWMSYVAVESADAACEKIKSHGGTVQQGPFDVMEVGRMAICQDPTGATFSVWQAKAHAGSGLMSEPGTPCWYELMTKGVEKAEKFYRDVFGWTVKLGTGDEMVYREICAPGASYPMGGMMELKPEQGPVPPHWMIYFTVEDCDASTRHAQELGGQVFVPPMDVPNVGRFSVLADPAGASFAVIKLSLEEHHEPKPAKPDKAVKPKKAKARKK